MDPKYEQKCKTGVSVIWTIETILEGKSRLLSRPMTYTEKIRLIDAYIEGLDEDVQDMVRHWESRRFKR